MKTKRKPFSTKDIAQRAKKPATSTKAQKPAIQGSAKRQKPNDHTSPTRDRALAALGRMRREHISLSEACREEHIKPATFRRYLGSAVRQEKPGGRFHAKTGDSFRRDLKIPTADGQQIVISVYGSKKASMIANYQNAVSEYLRTGKRAKLDSFRGKTVKVNGKDIDLMTDSASLLRLAEADVLHFDQLYASATGRG